MYPPGSLADPPDSPPYPPSVFAGLRDPPGSLAGPPSVFAGLRNPPGSLAGPPSVFAALGDPPGPLADPPGLLADPDPYIPPLAALYIPPTDDTALDSTSGSCKTLYASVSFASQAVIDSVKLGRLLVVLV